MPSPKPNISTVARAAGVSPSSVSNAYNRPQQLSPAVRERIFQVARELGYAGPDPAARSLRSRRAAAIGVLFTSGLSYAFLDPYCVDLLRGVAEVAERSGTSLVLMPLAPHTAALDDEATRESVRAVRQAVVDGVIADGIADGHPAMEVLRTRGLPLVRSVDDPDARCVLVDDHAGGRLIGEHLAALGHRDVAVVVDTSADDAFAASEPPPQRLFPYARLRLAGIREGLGARARVSVVAAGPNARDRGRAAGERLLGTADRPSAIAAVTDVLALGVLDAAREHGLTPGQDVSVTGFDDVPSAEEAFLTTIRQPVPDKGRLMGRMLLDDSFTERRVVLPTVLVPRASTAPVQPTADRDAGQRAHERSE